MMKFENENTNKKKHLENLKKKHIAGTSKNRAKDFYRKNRRRKNGFFEAKKKVKKQRNK